MSSVYIPQPPLSEYVDVIWIYEGYSQPHAQERLLPTGAMDLVISLDEDDRIGSAVSGARSEFAVLDTSRPFGIIGAHFKPGGGFPFFGTPAGELQNLGVPLDAVWGHDAIEVRDQMLEAKTAESRFCILEKALLAKAAGRLSHHPAVRYALGEFDRSSCCSVAEVTGRIGLSPRRFIEVFRNEVGLAPKVFCRIRRFQEVLKAIEDSTNVDWTEVALSCGYFDQAHFIHDFHAFSGINPSTYLRQRTSRNHVRI
jgi:AraC-like DNA-binding protein